MNKSEVSELKYMLETLPTTEKIADLRTKLEAIKKEVNEGLKVISYMEKLNKRKAILKN